MSVELNDHGEANASLLIRTTYGNDDGFRTLVGAATREYGVDGFAADFVPVEADELDGATPEQLVALDGHAWVVFVADEQTLIDDEPTLLVLDRHEEPGRSFRVTLPAAWSVENNLRLANMDFVDFFDAVGDDGVFRGFD